MKLLQTHSVFFTLHGFSVTAHGFFFALGALLATFFIIANRRMLGLSFNDALERCVAIFIIGLAGARLGYSVAYPGTWQTIGDIVAIWHGGLVSFTGIIAGLLVTALYARRLSFEKATQWYAIVVQATLLGWSIGRLGNYYAAESGGVASSFWHLTGGHVPIQLFEALGCLLLFLTLRFLTIRPLEQIWIGIGGYLILRFMVDFWRNEASFGLHVSQWVALICLIILAFFIKKYRGLEAS